MGRKISKEFTNAKLLKEKVCANCGSKDNVVFHHIVPVIAGGSDRITNIVPLCTKCHYKAHYYYKYRSAPKQCGTGRKRIGLSDEQMFILHDVLHGYLPSKSLAESIGQKHLNKSRIRREMEEFGYSDFSNKLGAILAVSGRVDKGHEIGWVQHTGSDEKIALLAPRDFNRQDAINFGLSTFRGQKING